MNECGSFVFVCACVSVRVCVFLIIFIFLASNETYTAINACSSLLLGLNLPSARINVVTSDKISWIYGEGI